MSESEKKGKPVLTLEEQAIKALRTIVRQMAGGHPVGHDAYLAARRVVKKIDGDVRGDARLKARAK